MKGKEIKRVMRNNKFCVELQDFGEDYTDCESNLLSKFYEGYNGVVSKGIVFKDEDMPLNKSLKEIFK